MTVSNFSTIEDMTFLAYVDGHAYKVEFFDHGHGAFHLFKVKAANPKASNTLADNWMIIPADPKEVTDEVRFIETFLNDVAQARRQSGRCPSDKQRK